MRAFARRAAPHVDPSRAQSPAVRALSSTPRQLQAELTRVVIMGFPRLHPGRIHGFCGNEHRDAPSRWRRSNTPNGESTSIEPSSGWRPVAISLHCWQGDDVGGFEDSGQEIGGGLAVTGQYPGKARTADELRCDLDKTLSLLPGSHRLNLHASYAETRPESRARRA